MVNFTGVSNDLVTASSNCARVKLRNGVVSPLIFTVPGSMLPGVAACGSGATGIGRPVFGSIIGGTGGSPPGG